MTDYRAYVADHLSETYLNVDDFTEAIASFTCGRDDARNDVVLREDELSKYMDRTAYYDGVESMDVV